VTRVKAGLIGLTGRGRLIHDSLQADPVIELIAVADHDRALAVRLAEETGAAPYDDARRAVVESAARGAQALFIALPPAETDEYLRVAAGLKLAAFVLPPVARRFDVAKELADLFAQADVPLVVARPWQCEPAYLRLHDLPSLAGHVFAAVADVSCPVDQPLDWQGDARRAGGGVLLHGGYEMTDAIVTLLGVPTEVYAVMGCSLPPGQTRLYDTEDAASIVCRYADDRTATVACRRAAAPENWSMTLCGSKATVNLSPESMTVTEGSDHRVTTTAVHTSNRLAPPVSVFVASLAAGVSRMPSDVTEHLGTMATIMAAYLSTRTGQPESPGKFLELPRVGER